MVQFLDFQRQPFHLSPDRIRIASVCSRTSTKFSLPFRCNGNPLHEELCLRAFQAKVRPHSIDNGGGMASMPSYYPARFPIRGFLVFPRGNSSALSMGLKPLNQCFVTHANFQSGYDRAFCGSASWAMIDKQANRAFPINQSSEVRCGSIRNLIHKVPPFLSGRNIRFTGGNQ